MSKVDTNTLSQFEQSLARMESQRNDLIGLVRPLSDAMRSWKPHKRERNIHELLMQIGTSECAVASKLGKRIAAPSEVTMMHYLYRTREIVLARLRELNDSQQPDAFDDGWDMDRVIEHILAEEQIYIAKIREIIARWRLDLLARLAAERAGLLSALLGLSPAQLNSKEPMPGWTIKDLLIHLAYWDGFHTNRMQLVMDGRMGEITEIGYEDDLDAMNAKLLAKQKAVPLAQAFAMLEKERRAFLAVLERLDDMALQSQIRLPWGWRTYMRDWAKWRYQHDATHARQIREWRAGLKAEEKRADGPVDLLRSLLRACHREFVSLLPLLAESEWTTYPVCGVWTMKDLVGHLSAWAEVGAAGLKQAAAGKTPEFDPIPDFEAWNLAEAAKRADWPWGKVWQAYKASYRELLDGLNGLTDTQLGMEFRTPWGTQNSLYRWLTVWPLHEREHAVDVRHTLKLKGWPKRLTEHPQK